MNEAALLIPVITCIVAVIGILAGTKLQRGPLISPFSITLLLLLSIFGIRPILMMEADLYSFYGSDIRGGFQTAEWVGLWATVALVLGFCFGRALAGIRSDLPAKVSALPAETEMTTLPYVVRAAGLTAVVLLVVWLIIMILLGGGVSYIATLFAGRSEAANSRMAGLPALVPALPVVAALIVAVGRIQVERVRRLTRNEALMYWIVVALCVVPPSALGARRFLIPSVVAALLGAAAAQWRRTISVRMALLAFAGFLVLAIFPFVRSAGSRTGRTDLIGAMADYFSAEGLGGTLEGFFVSYDTEMFNYIAYLAPRLGDSVPYGMGRGTIGDLLLAPIPAAISPATTWSNQILVSAFGGGCGVSVCPVPSVVGILFYDLALPGVFVGMLVLGILMSRFDRAFIEASGVRLASLLVLGAFTTQLVRGNTISQLWIAVQALIVLIAANWVVQRVASAQGRTAQAKIDASKPIVRRTVAAAGRKR